MRPSVRAIVAAVLALTGTLYGQAKRVEASPAEYEVYEAVLDLMDQMPREDIRIAISNESVSGKCHEGIVSSDHCSFLWIRPDTSAVVHRFLSSEWSRFDPSTWRDFVAKSYKTARLHDPLKTPWKHHFDDEAAPKTTSDWSPHLRLLLSRVGFNRRGTEAVVFVMILSYIDEVSTAGDYFLFRRDTHGRWQPKGRTTYLTRQSR